MNTYTIVPDDIQSLETAKIAVESMPNNIVGSCIQECSNSGGLKTTSDNSVTISRIIEKIYWSYGIEQQPITSVSRFYVDLNLHVQTQGYSCGESVTINIDGAMTDRLIGIVDANGAAVIPFVFKDRTVNIEGEI